MRVVPAVLAGGLAATLLAVAPGGAAAAEPGWERDAMSVPAAHGISKGAGVTVAVIDSGIVTDHPALDGRAENGPDFLDEDDEGKPWYGEHGTAMASDVLDVAPQAKVLGLRAIRDPDDPHYKTMNQVMKQGWDSGDDPNSVRNAIYYAVDQHVDVVSLSLGSDTMFSDYDDGVAQAIQYALTEGVPVIAAGGNSGDKDEIDETGNGGGENNIGYPAAYPGVLTVAATQPGGSRATFSSVHNYVDIAAPGVGINSADYRGDGRKPGDGTSDAAALTSGVAALLLSEYPELSPAQVSEVLMTTAAHPSKYSPLTGYGQIDAAAALKAAAEVKGTETMPVGTFGTGQHFGPGDDGTPARVQASLDTEYLGMAAVLGVPGLIAVIGGLLLLLRARKVRRAASIAMPPAGG